ncbi:MAG TPA: S8 family serine peptidase [Thermoanaerobaculia bacterium]|jgi:subtilisin family serine protease|nr:S8 family serine peptidase [Thermoanaerobaculia bacterium]
MKRAAFGALFFIVSLSAFAAPPRSVLVAMKPSARFAVKSLAAGVDVTSPGHNYTDLPIVHAFAAELSDDEIDALWKSPDVLLIEDDLPRYAIGLGTLKPRPQASTTGAVPQVRAYGIDLVHAPQAWTASRGAGVNVAVIDTGIDYKHADLKDVYAGGYNTITKTNDPFDDVGHGTHCSGIVAAADNGFGVVGVAPQVRLWGVKVLDQDGNGKTSNIIAGLNWVVQKKAEIGGKWIASLSLGSCSSSSIEQQAFDQARAAGVLVFAASGNHDPAQPDQCTAANNNAYSVSYPAAYSSVIAVAAIGADKSIASFSNFGPEVALSAPGVSVLSTLPTGTGAWSVVTSSVGGSVLSAPVSGSPAADVTLSYVYCGLGNPADFPASVAGKIALIKRGDLTFHDKSQNAKNAGAVGVVIFNKDSSSINWTLIGKVDATGKKNTACDDQSSAAYTQAGCKDDPADIAYAWPVTVGIPLADGELLSKATPQPISVLYRASDDYGTESGTSMACPHAAGVAALVWSIAPNASLADVRQALTATAHDLGAPSVDNLYGYGLIDAEAAGRQLNPGAFLVHGRMAGRRGH